MKTISILALSATSFGWPLVQAQTAPGSLYDETKSVVTQWAETENLISKELNDWKKEKAILEELESMLAIEKESLAEKIELAKESATEADKKRAEVLSRKEKLDAATTVTLEGIKRLEAKARELVPFMPETFKQSVAPLLRQLPTAGQKTELSNSIRLRNVVGLLSQANKFDNVISLETETKSFGDGTSKQVRSLYFGFAIAYYSDATGANAGYGYPTASGWVWKEAPEHGQAIRDGIAMYEKGKQAEFVTLPVVVN